MAEDQFFLPDQANGSGKCQHQAKETVGNDAKGGEDIMRSCLSAAAALHQVRSFVSNQSQKQPLFLPVKTVFY